MARTVRIHLFDDIDGSPADETVIFSLDGYSYEVDLTEAHARQLRDAVGPFATAARRTARGSVATATRTRKAPSPTRTDRDQTQAIRAWAKENDIELSARGRIPRTIVAQYESQGGK